jgi:hypothetical protein
LRESIGRLKNTVKARQFEEEFGLVMGPDQPEVSKEPEPGYQSRQAGAVDERYAIQIDYHAPYAVCGKLHKGVHQGFRPAAVQWSARLRQVNACSQLAIRYAHSLDPPERWFSLIRFLIWEYLITFPTCLPIRWLTSGYLILIET